MRLTKARTESICEAIENGHAVRFSCAFAGISQTTYFRWRARGLKALEARDDGIEPESNCRGTCKRVSVSSATFFRGGEPSVFSINAGEWIHQRQTAMHLS